VLYIKKKLKFNHTCLYCFIWNWFWFKV